MFDILTDLYCFVDDFCKLFNPEWKKHLIDNNLKKRNRTGELSMSEIMTIIIYFHQSHYRNFKHYYLTQILVHCKHYFPKAVSYPRFVALQKTIFVPLMFLRCKQPITRFGIHTLVKRYVDKIVSEFPDITKKRVSPHTIRHTTATHLLQSGVDINTIRAWLGHVSINTTNVYAEVDLEMKAKALACCEVTDDKKKRKPWRDDKDLMTFLNSL